MVPKVGAGPGEETAYAAIGGEAKIREIIAALYDRLFDDPIVGFLFQGKDKRHIVEQQLALTCALLGGPQRYKGKPLPAAHAELPLLPGHFDRRHRVLSEVLAAASVPEPVRQTWLTIDSGLRATVLGAGEQARERTQAKDGPPDGGV